MASFIGTTGNDAFQGLPSHNNSFSEIGLGFDRVVGGARKDYVSLGLTDTRLDSLDGGDGLDVLDLTKMQLATSTQPMLIEIRLGEAGTDGSISGRWLTSANGQFGIQVNPIATIRSFETVIGSRYNDLITGSSAADTLSGGDGNDTIDGRGGNDILRGDAGRDTLKGGTGGNYVDGGDGDDVISMTFDLSRDALLRDTVIGGSGLDTLTFEPTAANVLGVVVSLSTEFAPSISLPGVPVAPPSIDTGFITSKAAASASITQTFGEGTVTGIENVTGTNGADVIIGDRVGNVLRGGANDDLLSGETGADQLFGDAGNDTFESYADGASDVINGGSGIDTVTYHRAAQQVIVTLAEPGSEGTTSVYAPGPTGIPSFFLEDRLIDVENLVGSRHNDRLQGNSAVNDLKGGDGGDYLFGMGGNDVLNGGRGGDDLTGGAGADIFRIWDLGTGTEADEIMDFATGVDRIDLSGFFSNARTNHWASSAQPAPDLIGSAGFSGDGDAQVRVFQQSGLTRVQLDFGDGIADVDVLVHGIVAAGDFLF